MATNQLSFEVLQVFIRLVQQWNIIGVFKISFANNDYKLPGYEACVVIACGFSGHGFKFVSVIGEILADLATEGATTQPIDFLRLARFSG